MSDEKRWLRRGDEWAQTRQVEDDPPEEVEKASQIMTTALEACRRIGVRVEFRRGNDSLPVKWTNLRYVREVEHGP